MLTVPEQPDRPGQGRNSVAEVNEKVMEMVRKELEASPDASTTELHEKAKKVDPAMKDLSVRQFHARYPLQVKRKKSLAEGGGRRKKKNKRGRTSGSGSARAGRRSGASSQSEIHGVLVEFAKEISAANDRGPTAMLDVISNLDGWVARIEKARS